VLLENDGKIKNILFQDSILKLAVTTLIRFLMENLMAVVCTLFTVKEHYKGKAQLSLCLTKYHAMKTY